MGKKSHGPRNFNPSSNPQTSQDVVGASNTVSSDGQKTGKKQKNAKPSATTQDTALNVQAPSEPPKKPDTRTLIGGSSWTGKLPVNLLSEHCQKQKWEKPEYTMVKTPKGYLSTVILRQKNPKTQEITQLPPFRLPSAYEHLAFADSAVEARHFAATYALFRVSSMKNIHMTLPPNYRDLWKGDFMDIKKEDENQNKGYLYAADPFLAKKEREEDLMQKEKDREIRARREAKKAEEPESVLLYNVKGPDEFAKGWRTAPKVEMGDKMRLRLENLIKTRGKWNASATQIPSKHRTNLLEEIAQLGFRKSHIEEAIDLCKDREEVLEWLLIHVPEDDLPSWALPEGYNAGIRVQSQDTKREKIVKRLSDGGYSSDLCREAYEARGGNFQEAAQMLQDLLLNNTSRTLPEAENVEETWDSVSWEEESLALSSILDDRFEALDEKLCRIKLNTSQSVHVEFIRPTSDYPSNPPIVILSSDLPSYIQLSITKQCLEYALQTCLGDQMLYNLIDWLEHNIDKIVEAPGSLSAISGATLAGPRLDPNHEQRGQTKHENFKARKAVRLDPGGIESQKLLSKWSQRQETPEQRKMIEARKTLPAWGVQETLLQSLENHQVVIVAGETGSGKSTQAVQFILDDMIQRQLGEQSNIICTQPRRISALSLAERVAEERCSSVGNEIGYAIRGESRQKAGITKITFVTTGVLLRRLQTTNSSSESVLASLADVTHVVIDEVHERSLDTDFLLALLKDVLPKRRDLKLILMSATLESDTFIKYFGGNHLVGKVNIEGRTYPVEDLYLDDIATATGWSGQYGSVGRAIQNMGMGINYDLIATLIEQIDRSLGEKSGGILIFLPGTPEINRTIAVLRRSSNIFALPLHASLPPAEQRRVFRPAPRGQRKVIAATNVAETSITISDIVAVIDTGRVKEMRYDTHNSMSKLEETWVSRAAARQRRGRAGRVRAGECFKLYTRDAEARLMSERPEPEIRRVPLEQLCLSVKAMGIMDVPVFLSGTLTPPENISIERAIQTLHRVGAMDENILTPLGKHMSMVPADLRCAKLMLYGALFGHLEACITIASILTAKSPFVSPQDKRDEAQGVRLDFSDGHGDIIADMRAYDAWSAIRSSKSKAEQRSFCDRNFLNSQTLSDISANREQYISSLQDIGFLSHNYTPSQPQQPSYQVLHALLLAALHPNTARIAYPAQKFQATSTGTLAIDPDAKEIKYFSAENTRLFVHPSSTLFSYSAPSSLATAPAFLNYFSLVQTSKAFVRECSPASVHAMLLFGGKLEIDKRGRGLLVDGWARVKGWARIGVLVNRLRGILDEILERWVEYPPATETGARLAEDNEVIQAVVKFVELGGYDA